MSLFASRRNTLTEQRVIGQELEALLGAVEVTGLSSWERAKKIYGTELAEGDVARTPASGKGRDTENSRDDAGLAARSLNVSPSASPVQTPLFEEAA